MILFLKFKIILCLGIGIFICKINFSKSEKIVDYSTTKDDEAKV